MRIKALALASVFSLLAAPSYAQVIIGGGGSGGGTGTGTVTSVATGAGLCGGPITTTGTVAACETLGNSAAAITATTYHASPTNDAAKQLLFTGSSASAWDDAGTGTTASGLGFDIVNAGTANVTYTPAAGIDGSASLVVPFGSWAHVFYDGTTWRSEAGKSLSGVTAGTYGDSTHCASVTVDKYGRATAASQSTSCPGSITRDPVYTVGKLYSMGPEALATGQQMGNTVIHWRHIWISQPVTFSTFATKVTTLFSGGNLYLACADSTGTNGGPGTILGSMTSGGGGILMTSTGNASKAMSCAFPSRGWYWLGAAMDNTTAIVQGLASGDSYAAYEWGSDTQAHLGGSNTTIAPDYQTTGATPGTWANNPTITYVSQANIVQPYIIGTVGSIP